MGGRRDRDKARAHARYLHNRYGTKHAWKCPRCGARASHFVPPGMGDPGFYLCDVDPSFKGKDVRP